MLFALFAGLAAGLVHVLSGPDHLAAVAPLAVDGDRTHWKAGFQWGVGHTAGVLLIGLLLLGFRELLPIDAVSAYSERIVGLALIGVGAWGLSRARRLQVHRHSDGHVHAHVKPAAGTDVGAREHQAQHRHPHLHGHVHTRASFLMGTLHGLAGSSHLFGILPALALPTQSAALAYLSGFGVGAVTAMTAFAAAVGALATRVGQRGARAYGHLLYASSWAAVAVGGFWLVS
ncbi:MAG: High-affinity nickel transporter [Vicinamibacterales bacterium]